MPTKSPQPDLQAIEERVNNVLNAAMSHAIAERNKLVQSYRVAQREVEGLAGRLQTAEQRLASVERGASGVEANALQVIQDLKDEVGVVRTILAEVSGNDAGRYAAMVGNRVRIQGGAQEMVAAGLDEDGKMVCVYERHTGPTYAEIITVTVPPSVLALLPEKDVPAPAAKGSRKTGGRA